jgi:hypothetical protein
MGESGFGLGFGAEYITRWHVSAFATFGFVPPRKDPVFNEAPFALELDGDIGYRIGIGYYLFPKNSLHLGFFASWGTVYYDHHQEQGSDNIRDIIVLNGFEFDLTVTYLTDQWYFLQFLAGMYYAPEARNKSIAKDDWGEDQSIVVNKGGIPETGLVFGVGIGFALPEFFPDDTEQRRRERESGRRSGPARR